jgi:hypothetical protein
MSLEQDFQTVLEFVTKVKPFVEKLEPAIKALEDRMTALENKSSTVAPADVHAALDNHPALTEIRAFLDKWGSKSTANV